METSVHLFDTLPERWSAQDATADRLDATTTLPEGWGQGRALFGGLVVAAASALAGRWADGRSLRTVQSQLVAPAVPGALDGTLVRVREGRTTLIVDCTLAQEGRLVARVLLTYVRLQAGATEVEGPQAPDWPTSAEVPAMPFIDGASPEFTRNLRLHLVEGVLPFSGQDVRRIGAWMGLPAERASAELTLGLLDCFWTPTLARVDRPVPASTATWTAHLVGEPEVGLHQATCETVIARGGFTTEVTHLWGPSGRLVAWAEQTTVVFG